MAKLRKQWDNRRTMPRYSGRGDYKTTLRNIGKAIQTVGRQVVPAGTFAKLGSAMGAGTAGYLTANPYAATAGGYAGGYAGDKFSQLVGFGDYQVKANSLMDLPMGQQVAAFGNMSNATVVRHREFVQNIVVPTNPTPFAVQKLILNPALRAVFPWLSGLAGSYQEYQIIGCVIEFRSLASESAATLSLGSIAIASNYDTADPDYTDKRQMENSQFCVSGKPSVNMIHPIECDPKITAAPIKYTRSGSIATGTDIRLYDHCNVFVSTEGMPAGTGGAVVGELWITYEIALYKPQLGTVLSLRDHYFGSTASVGAINTANPLGTNAVVNLPRGGTATGVGTSISPGGVITFPRGTAPGMYEVSVQWFGAAGFCTVAPTSSVVALSGLTVKAYYKDATNSAIAASAPASAASLTQSYIVMCEVVAPLLSAATLTLAVTFGGSDATTYDLQIAAVGPNQL